MNTLALRDKRLIWHPFTQEKTAQLPIAIKKAKGSYVYDEQGRAYLDLISSWWVNLHGHAHPRIAEAIYQQAQTIEHILFAGFTHEPAVMLCEGLSEILPAVLSRYFFSDNGSTAVEIALKMSYQYWHNQRKERRLFLSLEGAYHGDTFGAMSVGLKSGYHNAFSPLCFEVLSIPYPETFEQDQEIELKEQKALEQLDLYLKTQGDQIAALILEPLVQGASGMRICRPSFIERLIQRVREYDILVIFDEVMTGFGRTGRHFALEYIDSKPDFICISKGITGGFLPLALTITTDQIYNAFLNDDNNYAFAHGHSYTANPLACAAAVASLTLLREASTQSAIQAIEQAHHQGLELLRHQCPQVFKIRRLGSISAFDLKNGQQLNAWLRSKFLEQGLLIRPIGQSIYLLPPYSTTKDELLSSYEQIRDIVSESSAISLGLSSCNKSRTC